MPAISVSTEALTYIDHLQDNGDGTVSAIMPDGSIVSCDTNGAIKFNPSGSSIGQYEKAKVNGNILVYKPWIENNKPVFCIKFLANIPNV